MKTLKLMDASWDNRDFNTTILWYPWMKVAEVLEELEGCTQPCLGVSIELNGSDLAEFVVNFLENNEEYGVTLKHEDLPVWLDQIKQTLDDIYLKSKVERLIKTGIGMWNELDGEPTEEWLARYRPWKDVLLALCLTKLVGMNHTGLHWEEWKADADGSDWLYLFNYLGDANPIEGIVRDYLSYCAEAEYTA